VQRDRARHRGHRGDRRGARRPARRAPGRPPHAVAGHPRRHRQRRSVPGLRRCRVHHRPGDRRGRRPDRAHRRALPTRDAAGPEGDLG
jgi:hypothetical protein